jgi:hypothetical protein
MNGTLVHTIPAYRHISNLGIDFPARLGKRTESSQLVSLGKNSLAMLGYNILDARYRNRSEYNLTAYAVSWFTI